MIEANVILDNPIWKKKIKNPKNYIKKRLISLSKIYFFRNKKQEFTLLLTNSKKMRNLNNKFRNKNKTTDVLSFPFFNNVKRNLYIGDIAISYEIVNKRSLNSNFFLEFDKMWIHGYLHLIGHKHQKIRDFKKMKKKENLIINYFHKVN